MKQHSLINLLLTRHSSLNFFAIALFLLIAANFSLINAFAQDETQRQVLTPEPPPLQIISKEEKKQLGDETDIKKRTKLSLLLIENRLKKAEELNAAQRFREMFDELGAFQALIANTFDFLNRRDNGRSDILSGFKRFEMSLRSFLPRLELIRRDLTPQYEPFVRSLVKYVRETRGKAVEPFFGDSGVSENEKSRGFIYLPLAFSMSNGISRSQIKQNE